MCKAYARLALSAVWSAGLLSFLATAACDRTPSRPPDAGAQPAKAELPKDAKARLDALVRLDLDAEIASSPTLATWLGAHAYDDRLDDVRLDAQAREAGRLKQLIDRLQAIDPSDLDANRRLDRELLLRRSQAALFELTEIRPLERNPVTYVDLLQSSIEDLIKDESTPTSEKLRTITARLWKMRSLTDEARRNLRGSVVPELYVRKAIELTQNARSFLAETLPKAVQVADPKLMDDFQKADGDATRALDDFAAWLQKDLLPRAHGDYALGAARLLEKLRLTEFVEGRTPEQLVQQAERELKDSKKRYDDAAKQLTGGKPGIDVMKLVEDDHGKPDELQPEAQATVESMVAFAKEGKLLTFPPDQSDRPKVLDMPPAQWGFVQLNAAAPLERPRDAYLYIDPVDKAWPDRRKQEHLRAFNRPVMVVTLLHEVIGHFVANERNRRAPTTMQKLALAGSFVEGWPGYAERMMIDQGFAGGDPRVRIVLERGIMLRAARMEAAVKLHAMGAKLDDIVKLFTDEVGLDEYVARREAERVALDPMVLVDAFGRMEIERLRDDWRAQHENASLGQFHDALLSHGSAPVLALRKVLLGEK
jgi:uncharacterized protein (DUF885 family)